MEDVKHEQMLMVTFSRAAAVEFKKRLKHLIGPSANYVDIKTFHSFCFDLLGRVGDIEKSENIVNETAHLIKNGEVEHSRITKTVMVIDEAQDMNLEAFNLLRAMIKRNPDMRVIVVGDDDQNIYEFNESSSQYMKKIADSKVSKLYELVENYRSKNNLVEFSNCYAESIGHRMKSIPIVAKDMTDGEIELIHYHHDNMMDGVVNQLVKDGAKGSVCILTSTNDEALQIAGRLIDLNIQAKLIQTSEQVKLKNLDEIRYFIQKLNLQEGDSTIEFDAWGNAKYEVNKKYARSENMSLLKRLFADFEVMAGSKKYVSDFFIFLRESKWEDFVYSGHDAIQVSTMHKAKGREFDTVIVMLDKFKDVTDEQRRLLYVAMTRAKSYLTIHYRDASLHHKFRKICSKTMSSVGDGKIGYNTEVRQELSGIRVSEMQNAYHTDDKIVFQLGYKDIFLSFFNNSDVQESIANQCSGDALSVDQQGCRNGLGKRILVFSKGFKEKLGKYVDQGFRLRDARVHQVVYWAGEEMEEEIRIVMPIVRLERK